MSVSSHKLNGPKGVGFLINEKGTITVPLLFGGEQERKRRAGTENLPAIVAFSEAVNIAQESMEENTEKYERYAKINIDFEERALLRSECKKGGKTASYRKYKFSGN